MCRGKRYERGGVEELQRLLEDFVVDAERVLRGYSVYRVVHGEGFELILVPVWLEGLLEKLGCPFAVGLHVASSRRGRLYPTLALGQLIEHAIVSCYLRLPERLVAKLTYGRSLLVNPRGLEHRLRGCSLVAVLSEVTGRFVAWALVSRQGGKLLIKPVVDVGWYLRSGV